MSTCAFCGFEGAEREVADWEKRLPTISEMSGSDPEFTGSLTTPEYIDAVRGGEPQPGAAAPRLRAFALVVLNWGWSGTADTPANQELIAAKRWLLEGARRALSNGEEVAE